MGAMAPDATVLPAGPSLALDGDGLTDPAAFPVSRPLTPRYADLGGDGRVTTVALGRWFEEARVAAELPRFRRLAESGGSGPFRILLATQRINRADTDLVAVGDDAEHWLGIAQAFAGPPGPGRERSGG